MFKTSELSYPVLLSELMIFIEKIKKEDTELALVDIIVEFAFQNGIEVELIGDAISEDNYFKSFIKKDCEFRKIFLIPDAPKNLKEW